MTNEILDYDTPFTTADVPIPLPPKATYKFLKQPQNLLAQLGSTITLPCVISQAYGTVQWTKNNFGLGIDRNLSAYNRYSMIGDEESGNYSLHIKNVKFEDEGLYQCQFSNQFVQMRSNYASVSVFKEVTANKTGKICFYKAEKMDAVVMKLKSRNGGSKMKISLWMICLMGLVFIIKFSRF